MLQKIFFWKFGSYMGINLFSYPIIFIFGLILGSFLNCVIYRLETKKSFLIGRSFCPYCKTTLRWQDLIPVLSFFWLKGKCRHCNAKISWQYPSVELTTGLLFLLIFNFQFSNLSAFSGEIFAGANIFKQYLIFNFLDLFYYFVISCFLIVIFVYDLKHYIIPDKVIYPAILVASIWQLAASAFLNLTPNYYLLTTIYSAFGAALFFLAIVIITRGKGMGVGDIKLAFLMGLILGWPKILVALFSAFFLGALTGLSLIALKKKTMKSEVPFGPFLITGVFLSLFLGEKIIDWYLGFFLLQ